MADQCKPQLTSLAASVNNWVDWPATIELRRVEWMKVYRVWTANPHWQVARIELSFEERARSKRFVHDRDRERFIAAHKALRTLIGDVDLATGPNGKPSCRGIGFNLSHSGDLALIAIADSDVGVDVEQITERDLELLAPTVFSAAELIAFAHAPHRPAAFFRAWVRKEAYVKMLGIGVSSALSSFDVSMDADVRDALLESRIAGAPRTRVVPLAIDDGYEAALATTDFDAKIELVELHPQL